MRIIELIEGADSRLSSKRALAFVYGICAVFLAFQGNLEMTITMLSAAAAHLGITIADRKFSK